MNKKPDKPEILSSDKQQQDEQPPSPPPQQHKKENEKNDPGPVSDQDYSSTKNQSGKNTDPDSED